MTNEQLHLENTLAALSSLHKYGWLRAKELGLILWPTTSFQRKEKGEKGKATVGPIRDTTTHGYAQACRATKLLVSNGLVLARKLPSQSGTAYVLASKGVEMLWDVGIKAKTGANIGSIDENKHWSPPATWKHDLLCAGVLIRLANTPEVQAVYAEKEIRRADRPLSKTPDGLVVYKSGRTVWVEVEQAKKTDPKKTKSLGDALGKAALGTIETVFLKPFDSKEPLPGDAAPPLLELNADAAMVVLDVACKHDHKANVARFIAKEMTSAVTIVWASCITARSGVMEVAYTSELVAPNAAARLGKVLTAGADAATKTSGNYDGTAWEIDKKTKSLTVAGVEVTTGLASVAAVKVMRNEVVLAVVNAKKMAEADEQMRLAPPGTPPWNAAKDKVHALALVAAAARLAESQAARYEEAGEPAYRNLPDYQRTFNGDLCVFESVKSPRKYQLRHNGVIVRRDLATLDLARAEMFPYSRENKQHIAA